MSMFEKFFGGLNTNNQQSTTTTQPNNTPPANQGTDPATGGTTMPANSDNGVQPQGSALDRMQDFWKTDDTSKPTGPQPVFNLTPEKLSEIAMATDFSKQLPAEMIQKAQSGDPTAMAALLNTSAQLGFKASLDATTKMINAAFAQREESFKNDVLPNLVNQHFKSAAIEEANPIFKHPAAEPMLKGLRQQILSKFPSASASEVSQLAGEMLQEFASSISGGGITIPGGNKNQKKPNTGEVDWATFLN